MGGSGAAAAAAWLKPPPLGRSLPAAIPTNCQEPRGEGPKMAPSCASRLACVPHAMGTLAPCLLPSLSLGEAGLKRRQAQQEAEKQGWWGSKEAAFLGLGPQSRFPRVRSRDPAWHSCPGDGTRGWVGELKVLMPFPSLVRFE